MLSSGSYSRKSGGNIIGVSRSTFTNFTAIANPF